MPSRGLFALGLLCMAYTLCAFALARRQATLTALLPLAWVGGLWHVACPSARDAASEQLGAGAGRVVGSCPPG
ncbi:MAG: hypothetical protein KatS3mg103_0973 [Phycisphaerales bacterium]|nr:MAG: hypothetical protein KatS3mg103_0973 [Phycisphaerales bacterium]